MNIWELLYELRRRLRLIECFFVGHNVHYDFSPNQLPDWCERCWYSADERNLEGPTVPSMLSTIYVWLCERDWRWFDALDDWLYGWMLRHWIQPPSWWEY
jgi:hypothetical protein